MITRRQCKTLAQLAKSVGRWLFEIFKSRIKLRYLYLVDSEAAGILRSCRSLHWLPLCSGGAKAWFGALGTPAPRPRFSLVPNASSVCYEIMTTK